MFSRNALCILSPLRLHTHWMPGCMLSAGNLTVQEELTSVSAHTYREMGVGGTRSKERLWVVLSNGLRPLATKKDFVGETI